MCVVPHSDKAGGHHFAPGHEEGEDGARCLAGTGLFLCVSACKVRSVVVLHLSAPVHYGPLSAQMV